MNPPGSPTSWLEKPALAGALLALMAAVVLSQSWSAPFYQFDDYAHIYLAVEENWNPSAARQSNAYDPWHALMYLEFVATVSYRVDYALFGVPRATSDNGAPPVNSTASEEVVRSFPAPSNAWAPGVRLMNGVYHALAGFLLWLLLRRLGASGGAALFTALVWTGHPMACESVCWIAERKNVLSALFGFAALLAWTAPREKRWRWPLVNALYLLALFSKPTALGLLPLFAILEIADPIQHSFTAIDPASWLRVALRLAFPAALSLGVVLLSVHGIQHDIVLPPGGSPWTAALTDAEIALRYIGNMIFPAKLSFFYGVDPIVSLGDGRFWICGLSVLLIFAALILLAGVQRRLAVVGVLWFVVVLGPSWNLIAIPYYMQDRYAYLASAGFFLAVTLAAESLLSRLRAEKFSVYPAVGVLTVMCCVTFVRSGQFKDEATLFLDAAQKQPRSAMARNCAASVIRPEYERHSVFGAEPDPQQEAFYGSMLLAQYEGALDCPDVENFFEVFYLRVKIADLLVQQGRFDDARAKLNGWLPPKDMTLLPENAVAGRGTRGGYMPQTLAFAWLVMAEANLRESFLPALAPEQRVEKCRQATAAADASRAAHLFDYKSVVMKARALIRLSELDKDKPELFARDIDAARALLQSVPATSERAGVARFLLEHLPKK